MAEEQREPVRTQRNSLESILVEDAKVLMGFLQSPGEEDDEAEVQALLEAEKQAQEAAAARKAKLEAVKQRQQAQAAAMEKRVTDKMSAIQTDDVNGLKRALAKSLLIIDDLRVTKDDLAQREAELSDLRNFKESIEKLLNPPAPEA